MSLSVAPSLPRDAAIDAFLAAQGWGGKRSKLAGDASFRRYERVQKDGKTAVLMDAPPQKEDVRPFVTVAKFLAESGFSAPKLYGADESQGLLLLEDLGDDLYSRLLSSGKADETELYRAATDVLVAIYKQREKSLAVAEYDDSLMMREVGLFSEWYLPAIVKNANALAISYEGLWQRLLKELPDIARVPVLRDYHADNLIWLPGRKNAARVGLLDFQDAVWGSPAYDMVSFLEDARRDVKADVVEACIRHFLEETKLDEKNFRLSYAMLGAQRNLKIIGIFTRLGKRDGKLQYQSYLPRVWAHLKNDLAHPALGELKQWIAAHVPVEWQNGKAPLV